MSFIKKKNKYLERVSSENSYSSYCNFAEFMRNNIDKKTIPQFKISILRNVTLEPLIPVLEGEVGLIGMQPDLYLGDFDSIATDVFNPQSDYFLHNPDLTILFQWLDGIAPSLVESSLTLSKEKVAETIHNVVATIKDQINAIRVHNSNSIIINNFPQIHRPSLGILDLQSDKSESLMYNRLNQAILELTQEEQNLFLFDLAGLYSRLGTLSAFDERHWTIAKAPFSKTSLVPIGQELGRFVRALTGNARKCIVLDCDNTLWGGIIGEDGMEGLKLGQNYPGNGFLALQKEILNLYHRGVIVALCSKNNEADVLNVLQKHPEMILKEEHIAAHRINWNDKADNIVSLSEELNIGLNSFVFLDDSEFECERVKEALPEVKVINLKNPTSSFKSLLKEQGLFDSLSLSYEDLFRTKTYQSNQFRKEMRASTSSLEEYLSNLEIKVRIEKVEEQQIPRVSQLTQKTNQFNLTTRRYTESDIRRFTQQKQSDVFYLWFKDKFSEFGIVGTAILSYDDEIVSIDSFLLSCRALGRGLEQALLISLLNTAKENKYKRMIGHYVPTKRNMQVEKFYQTNGFKISEKIEAEYFIDITSSNEKLFKMPKWITFLDKE